MKTTQIKILFITLLLLTAAPSLPAEEQVQNYLWEMIKIGYLDDIEWALVFGANVNGENDGGETVLMLAAGEGYFVTQKDRLTTVELFLKHNADVNHQDCGNRTALMGAAGKNHLKIAELLLKHKADINQQETTGWTALTHAVQNDHLEMVRLLAKNADITKGFDQDSTVLERAEKTVLERTEKNDDTEIIEIIRHLVIERQRKIASKLEEEVKNLPANLCKLISEFET